MRVHEQKVLENIQASSRKRGREITRCMQMIDDFTAALDNSSKQIWLWDRDQYECAHEHAWARACVYAIVHALWLQAKHNYREISPRQVHVGLYSSLCISPSLSSCCFPLNCFNLPPRLIAPHIDWSSLQNHFMQRLFNWFGPSHAPQSPPGLSISAVFNQAQYSLM